MKEEKLLPDYIPKAEENRNTFKLNKKADIRKSILDLKEMKRF
jgi:hypothetical protein